MIFRKIQYLKKFRFVFIFVFMKRIILMLVIVSCFFSSCSKVEEKKNLDGPLIGVWNYSDTKDNITVYTKNTQFIEGNGIKFNSDGTLVERKNAGFCGTPPITYADYDGTWSKINDTIIEMKAAYWGGTTTSRLDVEYVSSYTLKLITVSSESVPF